MNFANLSLHIIMADNDDPELKRLRMQRMRKILKQKQQAEAQSKQQINPVTEKMEMLLNVLLTPDAKHYLTQIKERDEATYHKIRQQLFPPQVMQELNLLWAYYQRGMIRRGVISRTEIRYLERKILGIDSSITIKKQGEDAMSLGDFLKEEE